MHDETKRVLAAVVLDRLDPNRCLDFCREGLKPKMEVVTPEMIERAFRDGQLACELNEDSGSKIVNPWIANSVMRTWWGRGYAYEFRLRRAFKAEIQLRESVEVLVKNSEAITSLKAMIDELERKVQQAMQAKSPGGES